MTAPPAYAIYDAQVLDEVTEFLDRFPGVHPALTKAAVLLRGTAAADFGILSGSLGLPDAPPYAARHLFSVAAVLRRIDEEADEVSQALDRALVDDIRHTFVPDPAYLEAAEILTSAAACAAAVEVFLGVFLETFGGAA